MTIYYVKLNVNDDDVNYNLTSHETTYEPHYYSNDKHMK